MGSLIWCGRLHHFDVNDDRNISTYHSRRATNSKIHSVDLGSGGGPHVEITALVLGRVARSVDIVMP